MCFTTNAGQAGYSHIPLCKFTHPYKCIVVDGLSHVTFLFCVCGTPHIVLVLTYLHLKSIGLYKNIWPFHWIINLHIQIIMKSRLLFIIGDLKGQGRG